MDWLFRDGKTFNLLIKYIALPLLKTGPAHWENQITSLPCDNTFPANQ